MMGMLHKNLTLSKTCETARALKQAQYNSEHYARTDTQISATAIMSGENVPQSEDYSAPLQTTHALVNAVIEKQQCWFSGGNFHNCSK